MSVHRLQFECEASCSF
ncbi:hypothetical protein CGLO_11522 [Colletotrichum gloeosporioides Cg-14]|uniref:Uncharacterized protein n=1 Tax=Colletotrichum gloeosporioides (strain Cg-14) TaxID=1237896 RepID=T0K0K1_COLGC|nr:hypothetical protein CGLO_11522 [Colletotrichum gloeosporioides Cg-14]